ncbi:hypothetical protein EGW08_018344, partial [Elysia chlorotica]
IYFIDIFLESSMIMMYETIFNISIISLFFSECYGTTNGFGYSGTIDMHYQRLKQRYTGCTYVNGNLEITNIWQAKNHDLSFLKDIRYVSGYVLFGVVSVEQIPMDSLVMIRGNHTKELMG